MRLKILIALILIVAAAFVVKSKFGKKEPAEQVENGNKVLNPVECKVYLLHEGELDRPFLVSINLSTKTPTLLKSDYPEGVEFESLDIEPNSKMLYAVSSEDGDLYQLDGLTGEPKKLGNVGFNKIATISFRPTDGSLWAWAEKNGLIKIDPKTLQSTLVQESPDHAIGMSWSPDGKLLYAAIEDLTEIQVYDPETNNLRKLADNLYRETEGFSMLEDGSLLGATQKDDDTLTIYSYDPATQTVGESVSIETVYNEARGIAWLPTCGDPFK